MNAEHSLTHESAEKTQVWETDDRYAQRFTAQIALCLRSILSRGDFLTVEFEGTQLVTQLLEVDSRSARFVFDLGGAPRDNRELIHADELMFRSQPSGIRTRFVTGRAVTTTFEGRPAFEAPFPDVLHYVQRREYYRVDAPMFDAFIASGADEAGASFQFELQDLSLGGVALRTRETRFESLEHGTLWKEVSLQVGKLGSVPVDLEVVAPRQVVTRTGERRTVLGCRFVELKGSAERVLQRAITQLEMDRKERAARL
ncbi:YcgR family protein [Caballeronia hypogeia]|uniref:Flagellar brake protein YcgR n=1 Tax=Caballeronia hypogeia TaxID=1777140 RepID=A0A158DQS6_9BURK|nr:flagellar brake protein [Caballeronia hypogeia]SAK96853.1 YcgR family protein [Caballeronia hypogeia]